MVRSPRSQTGKNPNRSSGPGPCLWAELFWNQTDENLLCFSKSPGEGIPQPFSVILEHVLTAHYQKVLFFDSLEFLLLLVQSSVAK
jgi:hypothetical protein